MTSKVAFQSKAFYDPMCINIEKKIMYAFIYKYMLAHINTEIYIY